MRICHVITRMIVGGAQENTLFTLRGHLENGHDAVLVTGPSPGPEGELLELAELDGVSVVTCPHLQRALSPTRDLKAYLWLKGYFRSQPFDLVHTHSSKAGILARKAAHRAGVPVVVHTIHGLPFHPYESWWRNRLYIIAERWAARFSRRVFVVADAMSRQALAAGIGTEDLYRTVYSGFDMEPLLNLKRDDALASELGIPDGCPVVGKVARLFELKGYRNLMKAAPIIAEAVPRVRFLIVGDGVLTDEIKRQVHDLGLTENFIFAGLVKPSEVMRYISLMDVVVHLSLREGLPRSLSQAAAAAKPCVGLDLDGTPEVIIDGQTGYVCTPGDHSAVATAVVSLLQNPERNGEMGRKGREHVRDKWDWRTMVRELEAEYERLLAEGTSAR